MDRPELFKSQVLTEITNDEMWAELVDSAKGSVLVEFFVTWCPHCQREAPIMDKLAPTLMSEGIAVYHANAEVMYDKGPVYELTETPSFILVENGQLKNKHEGFLDSEEIIAFAHGNGV